MEAASRGSVGRRVSFWTKRLFTRHGRGLMISLRQGALLMGWWSVGPCEAHEAATRAMSRVRVDLAVARFTPSKTPAMDGIRYNARRTQPRLRLTSGPAAAAAAR